MLLFKYKVRPHLYNGFTCNYKFYSKTNTLRKPKQTKLETISEVESAEVIEMNIRSYGKITESQQEQESVQNSNDIGDSVSASDISSDSNGIVNHNTSNTDDDIKNKMDYDHKHHLINTSQYPTFDFLAKLSYLTPHLQTIKNISQRSMVPLRSNSLIFMEVVKMIMSEQKLVPSLADWKTAKETYKSFYRSSLEFLFRNRDYTLRLTEMIIGQMKQITWKQVGRWFRIGAEMISFYYIGQLFGFLVAIPFK